MSFLQGFFIFLGASLLISPVIVWVVVSVLKRYAILDRPHLYKSEGKRPPAPYGIGISIFLVLAIFVPIIRILFPFSEILEQRLSILLIIGGCITLVSFIDDLDTIGKSRFSVPPLVRLMMQIVVGAIIGMTSIKISYITGVFGGILDLTDYSWSFMYSGFSITLYYIPILLTIFWYVLVFNSVNFSDGIPGLTGGFALISFLILAGLALKLSLTDTSIAATENSRFLMILLAIIIPVTFFITRLDIQRLALMGDSGTIMLGFLIATLSIVAGGKIATAVSVLGIYLIDFIYVITVRILKGVNPLKGDQTHHLHFRLLEIGFSPASVRNIIYFLSAFFGITAIFLDTKGKIALFLFIGIITIFLTQILSIVRKK